MSKQEHVQRKHMSRLTDLISKAKAIDPQLGTDMEREFRALSSRLPFGLNSNAINRKRWNCRNVRYAGETKVRVLPPRGSTTKGDQRLWQVKAICKGKKKADLELTASEEDGISDRCAGRPGRHRGVRRHDLSGAHSHGKSFSW